MKRLPFGDKVALQVLLMAFLVADAPGQTPMLAWTTPLPVRAPAGPVALNVGPRGIHVALRGHVYSLDSTGALKRDYDLRLDANNPIRAIASSGDTLWLLTENCDLITVTDSIRMRRLSVKVTFPYLDFRPLSVESGEVVFGLLSAAGGTGADIPYVRLDARRGSMDTIARVPQSSIGDIVPLEGMYISGPFAPGPLAVVGAGSFALAAWALEERNAAIVVERLDPLGKRLWVSRQIVNAIPIDNARRDSIVTALALEYASTYSFRSLTTQQRKQLIIDSWQPPPLMPPVLEAQIGLDGSVWLLMKGPDQPQYWMGLAASTGDPVATVRGEIGRLLAATETQLWTLSERGGMAVLNMYKYAQQ